MPPVIYGTAWKKSQTADLVYKALRAGFTGVDTACQPKHYSEDLVGEGIARARSEGLLERGDLFLQTKFTPFRGQDPERVPYDPSAPIRDQVRQSIDASLRNLRVDYVDSLLLHSPLNTLEETLEAWGAMEEAYVDGRARMLGISNCYDVGALASLAAGSEVTRPAVVQNRFYEEAGFDVEVRGWCREAGSAYQSFWTLTANPAALGSPVVQASAASRGATPAQAFFKFVQQLGCTPLTGTKSENHMRDDLAVAALEPLTTEEMAAIAEVLGIDACL